MERISISDDPDAVRFGVVHIFSLFYISDVSTKNMCFYVMKH